ncbi:MAG: hypothetical protein PVI78_05230 [Anaerolineales bacterium]|jgi:hypothetical protein
MSVNKASQERLRKAYRRKGLIHNMATTPAIGVAPSLIIDSYSWIDDGMALGLTLGPAFGENRSSRSFAREEREGDQA